MGSSEEVRQQPPYPPDPVVVLNATLAAASRSALYSERLRGVRIEALEDLRRIPITTRADLQYAGLHGTRAARLEDVCHYGESSGTTGASNSTWLTAADLNRNARVIRERHPEIFSPGRILLNRFPFMSAPAHLIQLIAQQGGGIAIPAGNINWDVPFHRALELAEATGAHVLAGMPLEPLILDQIARSRGAEAARRTQLDTFFLGGMPLPPALRRRIARLWSARVVELYGSTETMLLGTGCAAGTLHLETSLVHAEILRPRDDEPADFDEEGRLVITTLGLEGSPLVRFDTGDLVRLLPACACGDSRPGIVVLGRENDVVELGSARLHPHDLIDAGAAAADVLDSSVFFIVVLEDRLLVRIERGSSKGEPYPELHKRLGGVPIEVELVPPGFLLDVELLCHSPRVYKPVVVSDWRYQGRKLLSVSAGMMEWPRPGWARAWRWLVRTLRRTLRAYRLRLDRGPHA